MKAVLMSIQPKWCAKIANGEKTIEVRKSRPKLQTPFKVYIYCTKNTPYNPVVDLHYKKDGKWLKFTTGKVIGEFVCDRVAGEGETIRGNACLTVEELQDYCNGKDIYFWHISDLKIYDKPKELSEFNLAFHCFNLKNVVSKTNAFGDYVIKYHENSFCRICKYYNSDFGDCDKPAFQPLKRPPQSWCYVEELK